MTAPKTPIFVKQAKMKKSNNKKMDERVSRNREIYGANEEGGEI